MGLLNFLKRGPSKKKCARCGQRAAHGYSPTVESDPRQITPLCLICLTAQLSIDYSAFRGRAIVIAPAPNLPCYVFRDLEFLLAISADSARAVRDELAQPSLCADCKASAHCLWVESQGLTPDTFDQVLEKGPRSTVFTWGNPPPAPLCGKCTAQRLTKTLLADGFEYFDLCSPHYEQQGIVMPMAY
jgi:hypothetical protein